MKEADEERARKKQRLRQGMKVTPEKDEYDIKLRRHQIWRVFVLLLIAALAVGGFALWRRHQRQHVYETHTISWEKEIVTTGKDRYIAYRDFVLRYNRDGVSYINSQGEVVWTQSYEMTDPVATVNGSYAVIIDRDGFQAYICNENGHTGTISTILPIHKAAISAGGVTAVALEDDLADKVYFYDLTGRQMGIEIMTLLTEDGCTLDMSLSPDGKQLVSAYVYLDQGVMKNQVVFRNFGDEGQEMIKRLVGGFREYEGQLIGGTVFLSDVYACAFAQDRVCFYSLRNRISPQLVSQIDYEEEIFSIFYSSDYVGVISEGSSSVSKKLSVFSQSGEEVTAFETDFAYTGANFSGGCIVLYNTSGCRIYNMHGEIKYEASVGSNIAWLSCLSEETMVLIDGQTIRAITLN